MAQRDPAPRRVAQTQKQNSFFGGAAILAAGILIVKLIGMFYKIPLINIIGEAGAADFNNAYNIYAVLLTVSTAGLPVAVSKLVSEANALDRRNQVRRTFRLALVLFLALGLVSFLVMFFRADALAGMMNDSKAAAGIRALAPAVVCVGCLAALRGYSQGHSNMAPTSVSQIIEALCKLVVGLGLAFWLVKQGKDPDVAAAGAITGVTVGTVVALAYMVLDFLLSRGREDTRGTDRPDSAGSILANILKIAVPITLSSSMVGIVTVIDSSLVQGQLQSALDLTEQASRTLYGNYSGALNIYNLPTSLMAAITASVIPAVSAALARRDRRGAARITGSALRITALLSFPMGVGLFVLGTPIIRLLFPKLNVAVAGPLLSTLGIATPFVCMVLVCNSVLQAHGFINLPVIVMVLGGIVKIVNNYNLVGAIGIAGAPVGNILCFGLALVLDLVVITRVIPNRPRLLPIFAKPAIASAVMGGAAWAVYGLLSRILSSEQVDQAGQTVRAVSRMGNAAGILLAIAVAGVVYLVLVIALRAISRDDLALMPKGDKLARLLRL
ncbi:putative polysaccharide biosynthesis protein [Flintibacter faecis]|uniref:putative polysaccharide biosynthesis protein n=1 Tax=Flintibacter faecis TaxID=2763047 RepID=UPI001A9B4A4D|nr:polysaccharide biosynthesis protein [Flintibacter faecis]